MIKEYRPEINGLRAVAVLLVLIFHIDATLLPGGFLGVDVFLVISGYLISRNILFDLENSNFSFKDFYTRRIQRLLPVLGFTVLTTLVAGYFFLPAHFYEKLANSALFALLSGSNIFFWLADGYFNIGADLKPLLHTWSLGLEEQFYLIWPLALVGLYKIIPKFLHLSFLVIIGISLFLSELYLNSAPSAAFFLLPFRLFEFVLGAMCIKLESYVKNSRVLKEGLILLGLSSIVYSAFVFHKYTPMPGILSLIPCIGTMAVICGGATFLSSFLLNNKLAAIIGRASYSIYLFHWPFIVYYKLWKVEPYLVLSDKLLLLVISLIAGYLMYLLIEQPLRKLKLKTRQVWLSILGFFLLIAGLAYGIVNQHGFPQKDSNPYTLDRKELTKQKEKYWKDGGPQSYILEGSNEEEVLIMGNSHAIDLIYAFRNNGLKSSIVSLPSGHFCANFGALSLSEKDEKRCTRILNKNLKAEAWKTADKIYLHDDWKADDLENLRELLKKIRTKSKAPIYVFGPKMVYTRFAEVIIISSNSILPNNINSHAQGFARIKYRESQNASLKQLFKEAYFVENDIKYIDMLELQEGYELVSSKTAKLLYFDSNHFTEDGATEIGERLRAMHPYLFE